MRLYDAHNHLHDDRFGGRQEALVLACRESGVVRMVVNGSAESDWEAVAELARRHPDLVIPAFGLHPWYVHERSPNWRDRLQRHLDAVPGAGIGEIGLDRWILECPPAARAGVSPELAEHRAAPLEEQAEVFGEQMRMAAERGLPVSIHCLRAWGLLGDILRAGPRAERGFLLHSYGGPVDLVKAMVGLGAYFGFPGYFLHERKARQRETFRAIPEERLLVETDAPDQRLPSPEELRRVLGAGLESVVTRVLHGDDGRPLNHPANLGIVHGGLSVIRGLDPEALADRVGRNFGRLFGAGP